jgi:AraC-like DNA-binding protein/ligand-binding sensor protein
LADGPHLLPLTGREDFTPSTLPRASAIIASDNPPRWSSLHPLNLTPTRPKGAPAVTPDGSGFFGPNPLPADESARRSREIVAQVQKSPVYLAYERAFQGTTGLPLALRAVGSFQSPLVNASNANPFCRRMSENNKSCAACLRLQQLIEEGASREARTLECFAGLSESAVPIRVGSQVVAFLQTGQVFLRRPSEQRFRRCLQQLGELGVVTNEAGLEEAYFATPVVPQAQYDSILSLITLVAEHLSTLCNQIMVQSAALELPAVTQARAYIARHQTEEISLGDVAKAVNMSIFYFCKTFREETGVTFVDYLSRLRVEGVKTHLLDPHKRISEAAFQAGFQSLSQFNRVFLRIEGQTPTVYREG